MYSTITIGNKDYKLRLNAKACVDLEKKLGTNPLNVLMEVSNDSKIPSLGTLIAILHASLQSYEHGITEAKTYELYDMFVEEGNTLIDLIPIIIEVFKVSGFFKTAEKN
jgi:hypothetical protein